MSTKPRYNPKTFYLHLLEDTPAWFDGDQVVFANRSPKGRAALLVPTLEQIKREIRATEAYRYSLGLDFDEEMHGYVRVRLP